MALVSATPLPSVLQARTGRTYANHIAGSWQQAHSGKTFQVVSPADTRHVVGAFPESDRVDVARAVAAAQAAFPAWRDLTAPARAEILFKARQILLGRRDEWAQVISWEMGKILSEAQGELQRALDLLAFMGGEGRRPTGEVFPASQSGHLVYAKRRPVGVVGAITPWNFPANIPAWKILPALVYGNTVVFKPSELAPLSAMFLVEALLEAGLPSGVLNVVHGHSGVGEALVADPRVRAVTFTGSTRVGRLINQAASGNLTRCMLEMGGKNPAIVLADADLDLAMRDVVLGAFSTNGQRCNGTSLLLVQEAVASEVQERIVQAAKELRVGNPLEADVQVGPLISASARERVARYVNDARQQGVRVLCGGEALQTSGHAHGHFYLPTVLSGVTPRMPVACEEIFGPVLAILPITDLAQAMATVNGLSYGLSSALYTRDLKAALGYVDQIESGLIHVNLPTTASELSLPYGGLKDSGFGGREAGSSVEFYTEWQAVYVNPGS